jgi:hypothetical protein
VFSTTSDGASSPTERLRIDSSGRVGIGTTSPSQLLEIKGVNAQLVVNGTTTTDSGIEFQNNGTSFSEIKLNTSAGILDISETQTSGVVSFSTGTGGTERARIDSSGRLLVGTSSAIAIGGESSPKLQLIDASATSAGWFNLARFANSAGANAIQFGKSRGTTVGDYTIVQNNDALGSITFAGSDGTDLGSYGAQIKAEVDGTPGANDMPGRLVFSTTADGASSPTERLRITSAGNVGIGTSSPGEQLDVSSGTGGVIRVTSSDGSISAAGERIGKIEMYSSDGSSNGTGIAAYIEAVSQAAFTGQGRPTHLTFGTYNSGGSLGERVRITDAGNVGIGTTSPGFTLDIKAATNGLLRVNNSNESSHGSADARIVAGGSFYQNPVIVGSSIKFNTFNGSSEGERVRITSAGLVGIGTSSPISDIHILGTTGARIQNSADTDGQFLLTYSSNNPDFRMLDTTGTTTVKLLASGNSYFNGGNVGIGTTSPGALLDVSASAPELRISSSNGAQTSGSSIGKLSFYTPDGTTPGGAGVAAFIETLSSTTNGSDYQLLISKREGSGGGSNYINLGSSATGAISFGTNTSGSGTERMRIDSSGRLLVGTSTSRVSRLYYPSGDSALTSTEQIEGTGTGGSLLIVNNQAGTAGSSLVLGKSRGATTGSITAVASGDQLGTIQFNGIDVTTTGDLESCAGSIACEVDGTPGANDMPGRLVFSTTADGTSSPTERMRISSDGSTNHYTNHTNVHIVRSGNAAGTTDSIYVGARSATNTTNGTVVYRVYTNGTYATISDANQKKNVETTRDGYLDDLNKLRVVKYNWNEQEDTDPKELGLIAQEVEQVFPGLVTQIADDTEEQQYKGIKTSVLPFMLLKALQEASAKIEVLEAEVAALKAQ